MNWIDQITSAINASGKVVWTIFLSCATALSLDHFLPDLFVGLPEWVFPTIRIVAIFSFVLSIATIPPLVANKASSLWQLTYAPIKRQATRRKLLCLHVTEVIILCKALAEGNRTIWINPDWPQTINLQDNGLIRSRWLGVVSGDGTTSFEVPKEVWRTLLSMEEFRDFNREELLRTLKLKQTNTDTIILACLPQAHPAVRAESERRAASTKK